MLREIIPQAIRRSMRDSWFLLELARVRRSLPDRPGGLPTPEDLQTLSRAWGNVEWAAHVGTLLEVCRHARDTPGPILECGSGLTTILMGMLREEHRHGVTALEHEPTWLRRVQTVLRRAGTTRARLRYAPLRSHGDFDWYETPPAPEEPWSLVVCDGPPGDTRGGRSGLLPVVAEQLASHCTILLDDAERAGERRTLRAWQDTWPVTVEIVGEDDPPARAIVTWKS